MASTPGKVIRPLDTVVVHGEGMPIKKRPDEKGDLFITFEIDMPADDWLVGLDLKVRSQTL